LVRFTIKKQKIALFGTSADPPTAGHGEILRRLKEEYDIVGVWAADNPYKKHGSQLGQRMKMLELLVGEIEGAGEKIYLGSELSDRRSLTSVERAIEKWGEENEYTLVIGADLVGQIKSWYRVRDLFKITKLLIVPRADYTIDPIQIKEIEKLGAKYEIATKIKAPRVSSSEYRNRGDLSILTDSVREYIEQAKLYL
jgi:nicotinate-nucleotide adenylyltransferase